MSDTPAGPLWDDERISWFADNASSAWEAKHLRDAMKRVRDEERAPLLARIDELQRQLDTLRGERWVPVPNDTYHTDGPEIFTVENGRVTVYGSYYPAQIDLQQGYAICKRVTP